MANLALKVILTFLSISISSSAVTSKLASSFEIVNDPIGRDVIEGKNTNFQCTVDDVTNVEFKWTLEGEDVTDDDRRTVSAGLLQITGVDRVFDLGEFRCVATETVTGETKTSSPAELNIICEYQTRVFAHKMCLS